MLTSVDSSEPIGAGGPLPSLSVWSVISLVLLALALCAPALLLVLLPHHPADDPALGAEIALLVFVCLGALFGCTVLGVITGWVGVRRSRGYPELPWAGLALNSALLLLQLLLPLLILAVSEPGANWVVAPMIVMVGIVFAALAGVREFVGRAKRVNNPVPSGWRLWWVWFLGVGCGVGAMMGILSLTHPK
jgi:hypothetical protein